MWPSLVTLSHSVCTGSWWLINLRKINTAKHCPFFGIVHNHKNNQAFNKVYWVEYLQVFLENISSLMHIHIAREYCMTVYHLVYWLLNTLVMLSTNLQDPGHVYHSGSISSICVKHWLASFVPLQKIIIGNAIYMYKTSS